MLAQLKLFLKAVALDVKDTWNRCKVVVLAVAAIVVALEFQKLKQAFLVYMGKKEIQKDQVQDQKLATQETKASTDADALVEKSENEPVADDWYSKK